MMASVRFSSCSIIFDCSSFNCGMPMPPRSWSGNFMIFEKEPSFLTCRNCERKSSNVNSFFCKLLELLFSFVLIDLRLYFFDEREHVAHAEDALCDSIGIKRLERVVTFADADKLHWLTGNLFDRERRAAACVAVHLRQDHSGDSDAPVKLFSGANRVLTRHRVSDEQYLDGMRFGLI